MQSPIPGIVTVIVLLAHGLFFSAQAGVIQRPPDRLLHESDDFYEVGKFDEALAKYEDAEKVDPLSVDSKRALQFVNVTFLLTPPWSTLRNDRAAQAAYQARAVSAVRRILDRHPENDELLLTYSAEERRAGHAKELATYLNERLAREPKRVALIRESMLALAETSDRARLVEMSDRLLQATKNPDDLYSAGAIAYEVVKKCGDPPTDCASVIVRGEKLMRKAMEMRADYLEAMTYLNLLLKARAKTTTDPVLQKALVDEGDALRAKAMELLKKRKGSEQ